MTSPPLLPDLPRCVPRKRFPIGRRIGRAVLRVLGWTWEGAFPNLDRAVLVAWPHTSNWDGIIGLSALVSCEIRLRFYAKKRLFAPPLGWFLRILGGIPVDREHPRGVVDTAIRRFGRNDPFILGLMPEGTRRPDKGWRSGFHRIARGANVPICVVALDYGIKRIRLLGSFFPSSDLDAELRNLDNLLRDVRGKRPHRMTWPIPRATPASRPPPTP